MSLGLARTLVMSVTQIIALCYVQFEVGFQLNTMKSSRMQVRADLGVEEELGTEADLGEDLGLGAKRPKREQDEVHTAFPVQIGWG